MALCCSKGTPLVGVSVIAWSFDSQYLVSAAAAAAAARLTCDSARRGRQAVRNDNQNCTVWIFAVATGKIVAVIRAPRARGRAGGRPGRRRPVHTSRAGRARRRDAATSYPDGVVFTAVSPRHSDGDEPSVLVGARGRDSSGH